MPERTRSTQSSAALQSKMMKELVEAQQMEGAWLTAVAEGRAAIAGGRIDVGTAETARPAVCVSNPVDSGRVLVVARFAMMSSTSGDIHYFKNATMAGGITPSKLMTLNTQPTFDFKGEVLVGLDIITGTPESPVTYLPANTERVLDLGLPLWPGEMVCVQDTTTGNSRFYGNAYFYERSID